MMKSIFAIVYIFLVFGTKAQYSALRGNERSIIQEKSNNTYQKLNTIWGSTFDNPSEWVIDHDALDCNLDWKIGNDTCRGTFYIDTILSSSANDGWAMIDSDEYGTLTGGNDLEDAWLTTANPLDLTSTPNVVVEFETFYKRYNYERPYLVVGIGDGLGNVTWPDLDPMTDISSMNNVFDVFPNWPDVTFSDNPQKIRININSALTGAVNEVYFRLHWTGRWGYAWFVDDFKVLEQAQHDILIQNTWITNENTNGIQYAMTPIDQVESIWSIGADIYNFGFDDQTNVLFDADFTSFSISDSKGLIEYDSSYSLGTSSSQSLAVGLYEGTFSVVSDDETGGPEFGNNVVLRNFEISDSLYSIDGVGVHPISELKTSSIGTTTFDNSPDGTMLGAMYHIKQTSLVSGIRLMLAPGSEVGGTLVGSIVDSLEFWKASPSPILLTPDHNLTANDISNGYIDAYFSTPLMLDAGVYYAAAKLYSDNYTHNVLVINDLTITQPSYASAVNNKGVTYSNGNAIGVRLLMNGGWLALNENKMNDVNIYPNPSNGIVNIKSNHNDEFIIDVYDVVGNLLFTANKQGNTVIDLSLFGNGIYIINLSNETNSISKRVVIQ